MISQKALNTAEKCRFCWMCRHLCPVELQTGREVNTPRAKGLEISMIHRGIMEFDKDIAEIMYECILCDACTNDCATGYEPPLFIREARTEAVVRGLVPESVAKVLDNIKSSETIYGVKKNSYSNHENEEVLIYLGEVASVKLPKMVNALLSILKKAHVKFMILENEPASGAILGDLIGYVEETRQQAKKCAKAINDSNAKTVVVLDSYDAQIMIQKYPEWNCNLNAKVVTAVNYVDTLLKNNKISIARMQSGNAVFHDDDRSARFLHEFLPGREIAEALGYRVDEMFNHGRLAKSCGSSLTLAYMPEIVKKIAKGRWDDLRRTDADIMLTANPEAFECLYTEVPDGKKLVDIFEALDEATE